jgi:hypothetical protein
MVGGPDGRPAGGCGEAEVMSDEKQSRITMIHDQETSPPTFAEQFARMLAAAKPAPRGGWTMVRRHCCRCRVCDREFLAAAGWHCYCSYRCSNRASSAAQKRKRLARRAAVAVCSCGATIEAGPAGRLPRHCSSACRQRAYRLRRKFGIPEENEVPSLSQRKQSDD